MKKYIVTVSLMLVSFGLGVSVSKLDASVKPKVAISRAEAEAKAAWKILGLIEQVEQEDQFTRDGETRRAIFRGLLDRSIAEVESQYEVVDE